MLKTTAEASGARCPRARDTGSMCCVASQCMAWRWADPELDRPDPREWSFEVGDIPDNEYHALIKRLAVEEPARPGEVPCDAIWRPIHVDDDGDWIAGGYWVESDAGVQSRLEKLQAARRGYCGLAGVPA